MEAMETVLSFNEVKKKDILTLARFCQLGSCFFFGISCSGILQLNLIGSYSHGYVGACWVAKSDVSNKDVAQCNCGLGILKYFPRTTTGCYRSHSFVFIFFQKSLGSERGYATIASEVGGNSKTPTLLCWSNIQTGVAVIKFVHR